MQKFITSGFLIFSIAFGSLYASPTPYLKKDAENYKEGVHFRKRGLYDEAHAHFSAVVLSGSSDELMVKAMHNLGSISSKTEKYSEALGWFKRANEHSLSVFSMISKIIDVKRNTKKVDKKAMFVLFILVIINKINIL